MARKSILTVSVIGLVLSVSTSMAFAQVANPAEQQQGQAKAKDEPGKSKLGGTMPPNPGVPAMAPGAEQPASAGTTMGPDGKMTRNAPVPSGGASGMSGTSTSMTPPSTTK